MKRKDDTMQDTLLSHARSLVDEEGADCVTIRTIAKMAGVAAGTVYNYFSGKEEILLAVTQAYWEDTLKEAEYVISAPFFYEQIAELFAYLRERIHSNAGSLMRNLGNAEPLGHKRMSSMQEALGQLLISGMERDDAIPTKLWDDMFTQAQFAHFIVQNLILLLREESPDIRFLTELVRRMLYEER